MGWCKQRLFQCPFLEADSTCTDPSPFPFHTKMRLLSISSSLLGTLILFTYPVPHRVT